MIRKQISNYALSSFHLNGHNSYFEFFLMLAGYINLNPINNNNLWDNLPFHNGNLFIERTKYQSKFTSDNSNDK